MTYVVSSCRKEEEGLRKTEEMCSRPDSVLGVSDTGEKSVSSEKETRFHLRDTTTISDTLSRS